MYQVSNDAIELFYDFFSTGFVPNTSLPKVACFFHFLSEKTTGKRCVSYLKRHSSITNMRVPYIKGEMCARKRIF